MLNPQLAQHVVRFDGDDGDIFDIRSQSSSSDGGSIESVERRTNSRTSFLLWSPDVLLLGPFFAVAVTLPFLPTAGSSHAIHVAVGLIALLPLALSFFVADNPVSIVQKALAMSRTRTTSPASHTMVAATVESRLRTTRMLGSIGAPILQSSRCDVVPRSASQIRMIEDMVETHVEWIQTFDRVMLVLRHTASIQLGIGAHSPSVGRVERAWLARTIRAQRNSSPVLSVSLERVRRRLFQSMKNHNCLLFDIDKESYVPLTENTNHGVVTLSLLHSMRSESVELISTILDDLYSAEVGVVLEHRMLRTEKLCQTSREACAYFSSWLECHPTAALSCHTGSHNIHDEMVRLHQELDCLHSTLVGYCETLSCQDDSAPFDKKQLQVRWRDFKERVSSFHGLVDSFDCGPAEVVGSGAERAQDIHDTGNSAVASASQVSQSEMYVSGEPLATAGIRTESGYTIDKVLVYTGKGSVAPRKEKPDQKEQRQRVKSDPPAISASAEYELMEELNRHLRSMSQVEELAVLSAEDPVGDDDDPDLLGSKQGGSASEDDECFRLPARSQIEKAGSFLAELSKSIPAATQMSGDAAECFEATGY